MKKRTFYFILLLVVLLGGYFLALYLNNRSFKDENKQDILKLMDKLSKIEIDEEALKEQAKEIYGKVKDYVIKLEEQGVFEKIWDAIVTFFKSLFEIFKSVE